MILSAPDPALDRAFAAALLLLQHDAYRSQAELVGDDRLRALTDDEHSLPAWRGHYIVAWEGTHLLGAVAWRCGGGTSLHAQRAWGTVVEVDRVMVDPAVRRRGIATILLRTVLHHAGDAPVEALTGRDNAPGLALYRGLGFETIADEQASTGLWVTRLRRG